MFKFLINTPFIIFFSLSVALTQTSILFPQNIGSYKKVAGWPLAMYKIDYRILGDIKESDVIVHRIVKNNTNLMWERVFFNILLWNLLLYGAWIGYHRLKKA